MKLGILLSGGKDSLYSAYLASQYHELSCCITIKSENKESYMFHTPNINGVSLQADSMELPLILVSTKGEKEKELEQLKDALQKAKVEFGIEGIVTGAVASQYQASRIQKICHDLDLWCINPLWQIEQNTLLQELVDNNFKTLIVGVFAYPFDKSWLGKIIDSPIIKNLKLMQDKYEINPAGEGGEIETYVLDCPLFKKEIKVLESNSNFNNYAGTFEVSKAILVDKNTSNNSSLVSVPKIDKNIFLSKKNLVLNSSIDSFDVLIINTSTKNAPLYFYEFIRPLIDIVESQGLSFKVINIDDLATFLNFDGSNDFFTGNKILISGTSLKDNNFLKFKDSIACLVESNKDVFGICAGAELLLPEEFILDSILEIGPLFVEELNKDILTDGLDNKECFFLHQLGIKSIPFNSDIKALLATKEGIAAFKFPDKNIYGFQFHPEVSQKQIISKFLNL